MRTGDDGSTPDERRIEAVEADLHETRQELAETVDELTARLDVKSRATAALNAKKEQVSLAASRMRGQVAQGAGRAGARARVSMTDEFGRPTRETQIGAAAAGVVLIAVAVIVIWRRERR